MMELLDRCDVPPGVVNLANGGREVVDAICDHAGIRAVSFVGSTAVARHVYQRAIDSGTRVQALGGAENFIVLMPDADLERAIGIITESFCGCAGERRLAGSILAPVGNMHHEARDRMVQGANALTVSDGPRPGVTMGPVISAAPRDRVLEYIDRGAAEGATLLVDGRRTRVPDRPNGDFVGPSVFNHVSPSMAIGHDEIFGLGGSICPARSLEDAVGLMRATRTRTRRRSSPRAGKPRARARSMPRSRWSTSTSVWRRDGVLSVWGEPGTVSAAISKPTAATASSSIRTRRSRFRTGSSGVAAGSREDAQSVSVRDIVVPVAARRY